MFHVAGVLVLKLKVPVFLTFSYKWESNHFLFFLINFITLVFKAQINKFPSNFFFIKGCSFVQFFFSCKLVSFDFFFSSVARCKVSSFFLWVCYSFIFGLSLRLKNKKARGPIFTCIRGRSFFFHQPFEPCPNLILLR